MNTNDLRNKWGSFKAQKGLLQRLDPNHPMDFFIGINEKGNDELALFTTIEPAQMKSSEALEVEKNIRKDGRWATQILSLDEKNEDIFSRLCLDLVEVSVDVTSEQEGLNRVIKRFVAWQRLFANLKNDLPMSVLKGLVGELTFLKKLADHIGWERAIESWLGPEGSDRDFVLDYTWYEIKATSTGKDKVTISSLNQLEAENEGNLIIFHVDETSATDATAVSVVKLVDEIKEHIKNMPVQTQEFDNKLLKIGYLKKKSYEDIFFSIGDTWFYKVDNTFPKLVTASVPSEIVAVKYDLSITGIEKWKINEDSLWN